jgi:hypothetical protein
MLVPAIKQLILMAKNCFHIQDNRQQTAGRWRTGGIRQATADSRLRAGQQADLELLVGFLQLPVRPLQLRAGHATFVFVKFSKQIAKIMYRNNYCQHLLLALYLSSGCECLDLL